MILIVGGRAAGKRALAVSLGYSEDQMTCDPEQFAPVFFGAQEAARGLDEEGLTALADALAQREVVICTEVGAGVVPIDPEERAFRESAGRLAVALADRAACVVRVVCGIPQVLKGNLPRTGGVCSSAAENAGAAMAGCEGRPGADTVACGGGEPSASSGDLVASASPCGSVSSSEPDGSGAAFAQDAPCFLSIYRHAPTRMNRAHRYQGMQDEPLDWEGEQVAYAIEPSRTTRVVYVSPLSRSRQTARILFPSAQQVVVDGLAEMDFGDFDGFTYRELSDDPRYQEWVDSGCISQCPNGESRAQFVGRIAAGIRTVLCDARERGVSEAVVVAHGGTAMAAYSAFTQSDRDYFDWHMDVCGGLRARIVRFDGEDPALEEPVPVTPSESL
ncbi:MAG: bifunctional adenosylcobinamide kinase/adenosylcobinamide-phosphate guanylyltransferase [Eggerthellaceae bacterium]|nr:bifunctional adenosylcobinamide kinase/adenosylcobinamide-phosphate guanylyltransferase [Eggerthellaceae bacterium]